jgi:hypothetical protein
VVNGAVLFSPSSCGDRISEQLAFIGIVKYSSPAGILVGERQAKNKRKVWKTYEDI